MKNLEWQKALSGGPRYSLSSLPNSSNENFLCCIREFTLNNELHLKSQVAGLIDSRMYRYVPAFKDIELGTGTEEWNTEQFRTLIGVSWLAIS